MSIQVFNEALVTQDAAATELGNTTTQTSVIRADCFYTFPPGYFNRPGQQFRLTAWGMLSTVPLVDRAAGVGTLAFNIQAQGASLITTVALNMNATGHLQLPFWMKWLFRLNTIGTTGNFMGGALCAGRMWTLTAAQTDDPNVSGMFSVPIAAPAVSPNFNSTIANKLDFQAQFNAADPQNRVTVQQYIVEALT